jgi:gentisate 1,2-dioxygenase
MKIERPPTSPERAAFYARIDKDHLTPLWEVLGDLVLREPQSPCVPAMWKFARVKELLLEAGSLITAQEAERRVLVLENPGCAVRRRSRARCSAGCR